MRGIAHARRLLPILLMGPAISCSGSLNPAQPALRKASSELSFFATHDFLYRRFPRIITSKATDAQVSQSYQNAISSLTGANYTVSDLTQLLSDPSPRVRTLAMALLFDKDEPQLLPEIVALSGDSAPTFP